MLIKKHTIIIIIYFKFKFKKYINIILFLKLTMFFIKKYKTHLISTYYHKFLFKLNKKVPFFGITIIFYLN